MRVGIGIGIPRFYGARRGGASFTPTSLSGCVLWLRADLGVTLNGSTVSAWADQSGSGNHVSQGTAANQPTFTANDAACGNKATVAFDGTNDVLTSTNSVVSGNADHTIFLSFVWLTSGVFTGAVTVGGASTNSTVGSRLTKAFYGGAGVDIFGAGTLTTATRYTVGKVHASGNTVGYLAGAVDMASTPAVYAIGAGIRIGSYDSNFATCRIRCALIYNRALTAPEVALVTSYLDSA